ncbi:hypothetical protein [Carboxylicivirga sp. N1Y90]|uniref:hypothetical protein n=1 Tax=Carboxylicivirga fragile TaxID=3417571 RepID=UPI003D34695A|nr:hypothetical protein [Marinilabiliaceae bacterium N1Y90]
MIQEVEIIRLLISLGVLIFLFLRRDQLRVIPFSRLLMTGYLLLVIGWVLTILEGFILPDLLNVIEHICYASSSILLAIWSIMVFKLKRDAV